MGLGSWIEMGGFTMWRLLALALVGAALVIERAVAFSRASIDTNEFLGQVRRALMVNRSIREAIKICEQFKGAVPSIVKAGLLKYGEPTDAIEKTFENARLFELGRLERFLQALATIAVIAPLLGLLGTVIGFIDALDGSAEAAGAAEIAPALKGPLLPTAVGLVIAIALQIAYRWFRSRVRKTERDAETATNMVLESFGEMGRGARPAGGPVPSTEDVPSR